MPEAAEARAAQNDALMIEAAQTIAELRAERDGWMNRAGNAESDRARLALSESTAQAELRAIRVMLDDGGNGNSNTALDLVTRLQAAYAALWREAWIER